MARTFHVMLGLGLGTRLFPFTAGRPKCALPVFERTLCERQQEVFAGVDEHILLVQDAFDCSTGCGNATVVKTTFEQHWQLGWQFLVDFFKSARFGSDDTVVLTNADLLLSREWREILSTHRERGRDVTLGMWTGECRGPGTEGKIVYAKTDARRELAAMSGCDVIGEAFVSPGVSVFRVGAVSNLEPREDVADPWTDELVPRLIARGFRCGIFLSGAHWRDVGTWERLMHAQDDLRCGLAGTRNYARQWVDDKAQIDVGVSLTGKVSVAADVVIGNRAIIMDSIVMEGAQVGPAVRVSGSVILPGVSIWADVSDSVVGRDWRGAI
jgi:NDP-sugar pyrophosphorylase family protein